MEEEREASRNLNNGMCIRKTPVFCGFPAFARIEIVSANVTLKMRRSGGETKSRQSADESRGSRSRRCRVKKSQIIFDVNMMQSHGHNFQPRISHVAFQLRCPKQISRGFAEDFQALRRPADTAGFYVFNIISRFVSRARAHTLCV